MDKNPYITDGSGIETPEEKRGRPSLNQQNEIEEKIWPYFRDDISAMVAAKELKLNRKTVYRYYKIFAKRRRTINEGKFNEQCKINVESAEMAISSQILKLRKSQDQIELVIDNLVQTGNFSEKTYLQLQKEKREITKTIAYLVTSKTNIANSPTSDISLIRLTREVLEKIVP